MQNPDLLPRRRTLLISAALLAAAGALGVTSLWLGPSDCAPAGTGTALVGGPFNLVSHKGKPVTEKTFAGSYMLVFFGFTFCPQICPAELQVMSEALKQMGPKADQVIPVFVTIDPERDAPEQLAAYVENFDSKLVGLTGTADQIAAMAKAYRVFYAKVENKERPEDYTMDHSTILYLMGPDGTFRKHFSYSSDPAELAKDITQVIENKCD
jgi:cytochrome oxidase Cu insertion factor (SCO1/SenC/PrrC family)